MSQNLSFANQNLRDRSFKGKTLIGADFSGADIRGCDFCFSQLQDANFANVRTGKSQKQKAIATGLTFLMALTFAGMAMIASIVLMAFVVTLVIGSDNVNRETIYWVALIAIVIFAVGFAVTFTSSYTIAGNEGILTAILISCATAFAYGFLESAFTKNLVSGAFNAIAEASKFNPIAALLLFLAIEPLQIFASLYLFRSAINLWRTGAGTKFRHADLTNASFRNAILVSCDFSNAIADHVNWQQAQISRCKLPPNFDASKQ